MVGTIAAADAAPLASLGMANSLGNTSTAICCFTDPTTPNCLVNGFLGVVGFGFAGHTGKHVSDAVKQIDLGLEAAGVEITFLTFFGGVSDWFSIPLFWRNRSCF
ncbi:hypothetical protein HQQ81_02985 [Microbacteriaceae bacterium VKM Ac-2854]|nr:hypothetical protein [Microbacteriaceae bacterium VKM Ac-2854]